MAIEDFGFILTNGRRVSRSSAEFHEKLPITSKMLDAIDEDDDIHVILSALAGAIMDLEARGVEFDDEG